MGAGSIHRIQTAPSVHQQHGARHVIRRRAAEEEEGVGHRVKRLHLADRNRLQGAQWIEQNRARAPLTNRSAPLAWVRSAWTYWILAGSMPASRSRASASGGSRRSLMVTLAP